MRRRLAAPPSPELREDVAGAVSLYRVAMPPLRRVVVVSSSELSSSYLLFFTLFLFLDERGESVSFWEMEKIRK